MTVLSIRSVITFEFDGQPRLGGYSVWSASDRAVFMRLQKSTNGVDWLHVSGSQLTTKPAKGHYRRPLGVGSTLSGSSHGHRGRGYRLITTAQNGAPAVGHVGFWLTGTQHYRNPDRVVHLYNYLLARVSTALRQIDEPRLEAGHAVAHAGLVGPFHVRTPLVLNVTDGHALVSADGTRIEGEIQPDVDFYLRPAPGTSGATLTATSQHRLNGRVLTGVAAEGAARRFTPVALATPTDVEIHFEIRWDGDCEHR